MPTYYEETKDIKSVPCAGLRDDLLECLRATDCVQKYQMTPKECLMQNHSSVPEECFALRRTFFECKRSLFNVQTLAVHVESIPLKSLQSCANFSSSLECSEHGLQMSGLKLPLDNRQRFRGRKGY